MNLQQKKLSPLIIVTGLFAGFALAGIIYSCSLEEETGIGSASSEMPANHDFVGDQSCRSCHSEETEAWRGSHHDYAMKEATDEYVLGNFDNTEFTHQGDTYRFYREEDRYMVEAPDSTGELSEYEITHTFGWEPLQQYLVEFGRGKLQALNIAWDTEKEEWFALNPDEEIHHGDWLHWTGGAMNWNTMCADCHSTNLRENYIAEEDSFHTTWSDINVSCESCHGPGREHVEFMESDEAGEATIERIREDLRLTENSSQIGQVNQCAQCHSLREKLTDDYSHEGDFMDHFNPNLPHPDSWFADGQIREEVYVFASFLQSKMFHRGVECTDCHDPHTLKLKANVTDNSLCMQCHEPRYNTREHHFHEANTESSQCINCHMPGRYYMEVDFRRDHSFRVPRPDLTDKFGTPNACNDCHDDRSSAWAAEAVEEWYGKDRPNHFSETLVKADSLGPEVVPELETLIADTSHPDLARATAVWYLGQFGAEQSEETMREALESASPLIRRSAASAMANLSEDFRQNYLVEGLDDSVRAVRVAAVGGLAEFSASDIVSVYRRAFNEAMEEYRNQLDINQYFPQGQMNLGQYYEQRGETRKAIEAYRRALDRDPAFNAARVNLAHLYNRQGNNTEALEMLETVVEQEPQYGQGHYSLALLLAEEQRLEEALPHFEEAGELMPENGRVRYNHAIALQTLQQPEEAEEVYLQAIDLEPENPDFLYGICTLYIQQRQFREAQPHAEKLAELQPNNPQVQNLLQTVQNNLQN